MEKIPQHSHCQICGKAIPFGETICSDKCKTEYDDFLKKRRRYMYLMYGTLAVLLVLLLVMYMPK